MISLLTKIPVKIVRHLFDLDAVEANLEMYSKMWDLDD